MATVSASKSISRRRFFATALGAVAATHVGADTSVAATKAGHLPIGGKMPSLGGATGWINASPLTAADLRGKVILVQFWTYTCINWLRTHPYVRAWESRYKDRGLVVLGVHTPEFPFEKDFGNVRRAMQEMSIRYPVAVDSDYAIWRAFGNRYWPAFYFVDAQGRIRHQQFGEGEYQRSQAVIQQLLAEAGSAVTDDGLISVNGVGAEMAADWSNLRTPETYVGYEHMESFSSSNGAVLSTRLLYAAPRRLALSRWALAGQWTMERGHAELNAGAGRLAFRFHARDLHLVMGATDQSRPVRFRVKLDGAAPGPDHGTDLDVEGSGSVREPRLYQLVRQAGAIADRTFEIEFIEPGVRAYCFTFG